MRRNVLDSSSQRDLAAAVDFDMDSLATARQARPGTDALGVAVVVDWVAR